MALISIAVYNTIENKRIAYLTQCLDSLIETVNWDRHRLFLIDNASDEETQKLYENYSSKLPFTLIKNSLNIGTAKAINLGWVYKKEGEHCCKVDSDIKFNTKNWACLLEEALSKDNDLVVLGCKRKDCWEHDRHENPSLKSELRHLPHASGEKWFIVEKCNHIMGSALMYKSSFLKEFGYLYQADFLYSFDDALSSARVHAAGKYNAFLTELNIDHVDLGGDLYTDWKHKYSGERMHRFETIANDYLQSKRPIYQGPFDE